ncbi:MAG: putative zinc-binding protein [Candidatus Odinarchaeum yellowstonii]|uniref:Zinc-binding protein n=1 Tax=Odinarchaeota yellowstonii (strain LCB_4) TaxID=1841599 RepID=A0AAF0D1Z9_ODILC|nr:MAG: putative zinc-binding protein [Candidatus Odinarchaeum yellowstonii]
MEDKKIAIIACSGASNTGQITNEVAKKIIKNLKNTVMVCLPGVPLEAKTSMDKINQADIVVAIDGCPIKCANRLLEKYTGRKPDIETNIMTDYNVKKSSDPLSYTDEEAERIAQDLIKRIKQLQS